MPNIGIALAGGTLIGGVVVMLALWAFEEYRRSQQEQRRHAYQDRRSEPRSRPNVPPQPSNDCSICQDSLTAPLEILPCGHLFHRQCIKKWFEQRMACPVCRARITDDMINEYTQRLRI